MLFKVFIQGSKDIPSAYVRIDKDVAELESCLQFRHFFKWTIDTEWKLSWVNVCNLVSLLFAIQLRCIFTFQQEKTLI